MAENEVKGDVNNAKEDQIVKAEKLVIRLEEANRQAEIHNKRTEELISRQIISGRSSAGEGQAPTQEESPKEYAKRVMGGRI